MTERLRRAASFAAAIFFLPALSYSAPRISVIDGIVQVRKTGYENWDVVKAIPHGLVSGDSVRTGSRAKATILFDDNSRIELAANGSFTLDTSAPGQSGGALGFGRLRAFIEKLGSRRFVVRTPTAVCSVRGTEFQVDVNQGGKTVIDLYKGVLSVEDGRGRQILMQGNQHLEVDQKGMSELSVVPSQAAVQQSKLESVMRREMALDMSKEEVMAAAAREIKLAEYQQGKVMMDVFGQRVRLEEYIIRPAKDQFKLVVLNERASRFDYFYYLGTFNKELPRDLSIALRQIPGGLDTAPEYFLTTYETGRSNTKDSIVEIAQGGHSVDVNSNGNANDDIRYFYNGATESFDDVQGRSVFQTLYDKYGFYINGKLKYGWTGNNITSYTQVTGSSNNDPITGAALAQALPTRSINTTIDADNLHQIFYESYTDGTFTQWDNYIIKDDGQVATRAEFQHAVTGVDYKKGLLEFNYEQVITASEFNGRKIDLVVEPKILISAGLIQ
jgi:hypothetical protein